MDRTRRVVQVLWCGVYVPAPLPLSYIILRAVPCAVFCSGTLGATHAKPDPSTPPGLLTTHAVRASSYPASRTPRTSTGSRCASSRGRPKGRERLAVKVVSKVKQGEPDGHLVRPVNLERSVDRCTKLGDDEISGCLNKLPSWQDAARPLGPRPRATHGGGCSRTAPGQRRATRTPQGTGETSSSEVSSRFGAARSRWTWALHGLPQTENLGFLQWLDQMEEQWQGVAVTRWPGVMKRLAWVQGLDVAMGWRLTMSDLRGDIRRNFAGEMMLSAYRDGGSHPDARRAVPRCKFVLPAAPRARRPAMAPLPTSTAGSISSCSRGRYRRCQTSRASGRRAQTRRSSCSSRRRAPAGRRRRRWRSPTPTSGCAVTLRARCSASFSSDGEAQDADLPPLLGGHAPDRPAAHAPRRHARDVRELRRRGREASVRHCRSRRG